MIDFNLPKQENTPSENEDHKIDSENENNHYPDKFVVVRIETENFGVAIKVLASWYGGFAGSNSWKLSSGIIKISMTESGYEFLNHSGSTYFCSKNSYGMSSYTASIYDNLTTQIKELPGVNSISIVDEEVFERGDINLN